MKRYLYLSMLGAALLFTSCKKHVETVEETKTETKIDSAGAAIDHAAHAVGDAADAIQGEALTALLKEYDLGIAELMKLGRAVKRGDAEAKTKATELSHKLKEVEAKLEKNAAAFSEANKEDFKRFKERLEKQTKEMGL